MTITAGAAPAEARNGLLALAGDIDQVIAEGLARERCHGESGLKARPGKPYPEFLAPGLGT